MKNIYLLEKSSFNRQGDLNYKSEQLGYFESATRCLKFQLYFNKRYPSIISNMFTTYSTVILKIRREKMKINQK